MRLLGDLMLVEIGFLFDWIGLDWIGLLLNLINRPLEEAMKVVFFY